jgi:hypothetical protein
LVTPYAMINVGQEGLREVMPGINFTVVAQKLSKSHLLLRFDIGIVSIRVEHNHRKWQHLHRRVWRGIKRRAREGKGREGKGREDMRWDETKHSRGQTTEAL